MKQEEPAHIMQQLQNVPVGGLTVIHNSTSGQEYVLLTDQFSAETVGKGKSVDLHALKTNCLEILKEADLDLQTVQTIFCSGNPTALPGHPELQGIFEPLYSAPSFRRRAYLQLKVQELLLYLADIQPGKRRLTKYVSQQTELIKEIHHQLTEHFGQRFTIEELSKQYLINTSTLKEVFKGVYGMPIAAYMKEYRIRQAMKLLMETDLPTSQIADLVGYHTQGKFSKAFQDVTKMLPTEYRRTQDSNRKC